MKIKVICLITVALLLSSVTSFAACPEHTTLYFVNGVDTKVNSAEQSSTRIRSELAKKGVTDECISFDIAYNTNEPLFLDFMEAGLQLAEEENGQVIDYWKFFFRAINTSFSGSASPFNQLVFDYFWHTGLVIEAGEFVLGDQLNEHLYFYRKKLSEGEQLILLGHSQGNLYVNEVWDQLSIVEQASTSTIAVATPSNRVGYGTEPYTSLNQDALAASIFSAFGALPTNMDMNEPCDDKLFGLIPTPWQCHGFKETYMTDMNPRERILNHIVAALPASNNNVAAEIYGQVYIGLDKAGPATISVYTAENKPRLTFDSDAEGRFLLFMPECVGCYMVAQMEIMENGELVSYSGRTNIDIFSGESYDLNIDLYPDVNPVPI